MSAATTLSYLDSYCERAGEAGLMAEPLNAFTNLAFIIAAMFAISLWRNSREATWRGSIDIIVLIVLLFAIGLGSGAWHFFADSHTLLMDVIPIVLFMNLFLIAAAIRLLGLKWWGALLLFGLFQVLNIGSEMYLPRDFLNGTIMYLPAYGLLMAIVIWVNAKRNITRHLLFKALFLWSLSLAFRTLDTELCPVLPIGTHFLWHIVNAMVLYLLLKSLITAQAVSLTRR